MARCAPVLAAASVLFAASVLVASLAGALFGAPVAAAAGTDRVIRVEPRHVAAEQAAVEDGASGVRASEDLARWPELRYAPDGDAASRDAPEEATVVPEDVDRVLPETLEYWEHRQHLADARIAAGQPVGGTALVGVRLAPQRAAGRVHAIDGDPVTTGLAAWDGFGAFVLEVVKGSPADDAGLQTGDVIVQYGGIWVDTHELLVQLASRSTVGHEKEVWLLRGDVVLKTWLVPGER